MPAAVVTRHNVLNLRRDFSDAGHLRHNLCQTGRTGACEELLHAQQQLERWLYELELQQFEL